MSHSQAIVTISVARDTLDLDQTLWRLGLLLGSVSLGAAMLSVVVLIAVVQIHSEAGCSVGRPDLRRSTLPTFRAKGQLTCSIEELDPVVDRLNELLERLDTAFAREKAFTADVAHELRTPLAGLSAGFGGLLFSTSGRSGLQRSHPEMPGHDPEQCRSMVENLLTLARADAGQLTLQKEPLDLMQLRRRVLASVRRACDQARASCSMAERYRAHQRRDRSREAASRAPQPLR